MPSFHECLSMEEIKKTIAKNIVGLRRYNHMTQAELAERLCYSDKAISKWERGESIPDVFILKQIADMFSVTVDYLLTDHEGEKVTPGEDAKYKNNNHLIITLLSIGLVWLIGTTVFVTLKVSPIDISMLWLAFIWPVPISFILILIFNSIWGKPIFNYLIISFLMWTLLVSICLSMIEFNVWLILTIGIPGQIIILLWSGMSKTLWAKKHRKKEKDEEIEDLLP